MTTVAAPHPWSHESLVGKARLFIEIMEAHPVDDSKFALWSALALELLARAALAHISPVLLADAGNWRNAAYALGRTATQKKFTPSSIATKEVFARLNELVPTFTEEIAGFCARHADRRNAELHTGELAFANLGTSSWLPRYHQACAVLLSVFGATLADWVTDPSSAQAMIDSLGDAAAKSVARDVKAHAQVWENKTAEEREAAALQATATTTRQAGHRTSCPSCKCPALLQGSPAGPVATEIRDDEVVQRQTMVPNAFVCAACGLRILGLSRLSAAGLGDAFSAKSTYSPAEHFGLYTEDDLEDARQSGDEEEDFNEY
jgi:hypothetical protein